MRKNANNFAYIDGANLYEAIKELGWPIDYKRFRIWLSERSTLDVRKEKAPDAD